MTRQKRICRNTINIFTLYVMSVAISFFYDGGVCKKYRELSFYCSEKEKEIKILATFGCGAKTLP